MNIFALDSDPAKAAKYHCDKHVVKMASEYCQILCTTIHFVINKQIDANVKMEEHIKTCTNCRDNMMGYNYEEQINHLLDFSKTIPYKIYQPNHPSCKWVRESTNNFLWLLSLCEHTHKEYTKRYNKIHKSMVIMDFITNPHRFLHILNLVGSLSGDIFPHFIEKNNKGITPIPQVMPLLYQSDRDNFIEAYRNLYIYNKSRFAKWAHFDTPSWYENKYDGIIHKKK